MPDLEKIGVQHHHAHIASCMAENGLRGKAIGVALDGTGYGTDGKIWGGEFLVADYGGFERRAHLRYVPLAGGDAAVRQPWRPALAYLADTFGPAAEFPELAIWRDVPESQRKVVRSMIAHRVNTIDTSSCGRLFDAVASLIGLRQQINFEGQAAIELETIAAEGVADSYPFGLDARHAWTSGRRSNASWRRCARARRRRRLRRGFTIRWRKRSWKFAGACARKRS